MKSTLKIIILLFSLNTFAQNVQLDDPRLTPFIGTWTVQYDQNKVFSITLWREDHNVLQGNYKIEILGSNGNVVKTYKSNFTHPNTNQEMPPMIYGGANSSTNVYGSISDITINVEQGLSNRKSKEGDFKMIIQNGSNLSTAVWTVEKTPGLKLESYPDHYSIPTDITLTKVE